MFSRIFHRHTFTLYACVNATPIPDLIERCDCGKQGRAWLAQQVTTPSTHTTRG